MSRYVFKLPDLGEGTVDAEIVSWRVQPGDEVAEDDVIAELMTDKAVVELPAPVSGRIVSLAGDPGDKVAVGAELIVFETASEADAAQVPQDGAGTDQHGGAARRTGAEGQTGTATAQAGAGARSAAPAGPPDVRGVNSEREGTGSATPGRAAGPRPGGRVMTSPAIRRRAREAGVDLADVAGSGPQGRIMRADLQAHLAQRPHQSGRTRPERPAARGLQGDGTEEIRLVGLRRAIAERMSRSARDIPHFSYVEEVDVTELEALRQHLNASRPAQAPALTYLPFLVLGLTRVLPEFPQCNAVFDAEREVIVRHRAVHAGIATQTPDGLKVPVVRHCESRSLAELAAEMRRVAQAARDNTARRDQLAGSTITVTSLGRLGGIASTPLINAPEVAIIGVNRAIERPVVRAGAITTRRMMNLSSSFDHRCVDGHDAAAMIQALRQRLEHPATLFMDNPWRTG